MISASSRISDHMVSTQDILLQIDWVCGKVRCGDLMKSTQLSGKDS